jgi:adenylate cyclase
VPYLIYQPETPNEIIHQLRFGINSIGREKDNSIVIIHGNLSRQHAELTIGYNRAAITDLCSLNGTFVNEVKIDRCELKDGDWIRCGSVVFKYVDKLRSLEPESLADKDDGVSIIKQVSPEPTHMAMQDLLVEDGTNGSVIKLQQHDIGQRAVDKLKILLEVSKQLSSPEEPDRLLEKILNLLLEIMNVDRAAILLVSEVTKHLERKAVKSRAGIPEDNQFYSTKITNFVRHKGEAILSADARSDKRFSGSDSILMQAIHASMCVPLKPREEVIGVLYVDNLSLADIYADEDVEFLTALANQAAIAIQNSQLYKQMQAEAVMRDKLERFFPEAVSRKLREEGNLGILEAEVTALFADISDFTVMSSTMEPRQVIEMLNDYFKVIVEDIVFPYEGTLEKYIGDALLAVWGAPYPKLDDADRAVRAAIEMQWAVRRLNQEWIQQQRRPIQIHIGLNTGRVAAGNIGSEKLIQYAHIGDTTNVASRICSAAQADEIMIDQSTFSKLKNRSLPLEKVPPTKVKGKKQPLQLYRVHWEQVPSVVPQSSSQRTDPLR